MVIVGIAISLRILSSAQQDARPPGVLAYAVGALMAALLPARRRFPLGLLLATVGLVVIYHLLNNPGISPVIALSIPLYAAAAAGHLRWATGAACVSIAATAFFTLFGHGQPLASAAVELLPQAALLGVLVLLGEAVNNRRALARAAERAAEHAILDREREANRRVTEERLRMARELHDMLAHTLAGAAVQASVAADTMTDDPDTCREAIERVRSCFREARTELAATVGVLRAGRNGSDPDSGRSPMPTLAQVGSLLEAGRQARLQVELASSGVQRNIPPTVDLTAYRIIQESITNVVKHADARSVTVSLDYKPEDLIVSVVDDGQGAPPVPRAGDGGYGLAGMRERAAAVGGRLSAGPGVNGGFQVIATLPIPAPAGRASAR